MKAGRALGVIAVMLAFVLSGIALDRAAQRHYLAEGEAQTRAALRLTAQALDGYLRRFMAVPGLLAETDELQRLIAAPSNATAVTAMNDWLAATNAQLDASAILVLGADGRLLATNQPDRAASLLGDAEIAQEVVSNPYGPSRAGPASGRGGGLSQLCLLRADPRRAGRSGWHRRGDGRSRPGRGGMAGGRERHPRDRSRWPGRAGHRSLLAPPDLRPVAADRADRTGDGVASVIPATLSMPERGVEVVRMTDGDGVSRVFIMARQLMPLTDWKVHVLLDAAPVRGRRICFWHPASWCSARWPCSPASSCSGASGWPSASAFRIRPRPSSSSAWPNARRTSPASTPR